MNIQPIETYLPHATPMIFLEQLTNISENHVVCSVAVSQDGVLAPFLNEHNALPSWYLIEIMAQTIGVWNGYYAKQQQQPPQLAFLLGSRSFQTQLSVLPLGTQISIRAEMVLRDEHLANFDCSAIVENKTVATAKLNVYEPDSEVLAQILQRK